MPKQVDQRVVQMDFDNKKFEEGVKTTLESINTLNSTLDKLKNVSLSGLENIGSFIKGVNFEPIINAAESVSTRMSSMGVVATTVLYDLTQGAVNAAMALERMSIGQIMSGGKQRALNIEAAKFQLEGLHVAWEDIKEDINYAVKGTAYGLDEAAKAASQLVASKVKVGEEMANTLRAISGVAAMTNRSYDETAAIFTTVAGNGRLMSDQLLSLSSRGLNAAATLGEQLGKTEKEIRDMTSKGEIDFKTFSKAMYDAFGEHAVNANKTFTGALSNMKSALSRIGEAFYTPGLQYARDTFNALTLAIDQFKTSLTDYKVFDNAAAIMKTLSENAVAFFETLGGSKGAMNKRVGGLLKYVSGVLGNISSLLNRGLHLKVLDALGIALLNVSKIARAIIAGIKKAFPIDILGDITHFVNVITSKVTEFDKRATIYMRIRDTVAGIASVLRIIYKSVKAVWDVLGKPIFDRLVSDIKEFLKWTGDLGNKLTEFSQDFDLYTPLFNGVQKIKLVLIPAINESLEKINQNFKEKFGKDIPETIDTIKNKISGMFTGRNKIEKEAKRLAEQGHNPFGILAKEFGVTEEEIHRMVKEGEIDFETFAAAMNRNLGAGTVVQNSINGLGLITGLINVLTQAIIILTDVLSVFYNVFSGGASIFDYISQGWDKVIEGFNKFIAFMQGGDLSGVFDKELSPEMQEFLTDVRDIFANFVQIAKDAYASIKPVFKGIGEVLKTMTFDDITKALKTGGGLVLFKIILDKLIAFGKGFKFAFMPLQVTAATIKSTMGSITGYFKKLTEGVRIDNIKSIAISVALLAGSILVLSSIEEDKLNRGLAAVTALVAELVGVYKLLEGPSNKIDDDNVILSFGDSLLEKGKVFAVTTAILELGVALFIMASALKKVSNIDSEKLGTSFFVLTMMFGELVGSIYLLSKVKNDVPDIAKSLLAMTIGIRILASAMAVIAKLGDKGAGIALASVLGLLVEIATFFGAMKAVSITGGDKNNFAGVAASVILLAIALNLMIAPLAAMALMGERLGPAIVGMGFLLGELAIFAGIMNDVGAGQFAGLAASLIIFAVALNMLMIPLAALGLMANGGVLWEAILAFTALLAIMAGFSAVMAIMGKMAVDLAVLGGVLIIFAAALILLMVPLNNIAKLAEKGSLWEAILGLVALLAVIVGFTAVMAILGSFAIELLLLGAALALIGIGVAGVGTGFALLAATVYIIVAAFKLLVETMILAGDEILKFAVMAALSIVEFMVTLGNATPQIVESIAAIIVAVCDAIIAASTKIVDTIFVLIIKILDVLTDRVPTIILDLLEMIVAILDGLFKGLTTYIPVLARDLYNFCMAVLDELVKLMKQTPYDLFDIFFGNGFEKDKNSGQKFGSWLKGLFSKSEDSKDVKEAGEKTAEAVVESTAEKIESPESQNEINGSLDSLVAGAGKYISGSTVLNDSMEGLSVGGLDTFSDMMQVKNGESGVMKDFGYMIPESLSSGVDEQSKMFNESMYNMVDGGINTAQDRLKMHSPSKVMMDMGKYIDEGLAIGIDSSKDSEKSLSNKATGLMHIFDTVGEQASKMKLPTDGLLSAFSDANTSPTITPVLDLSNVNQGFASLDSLFSANRSLQLASDAAYLNDAGRNLNLQIQNNNRNGTNSSINSLGSKIDRLGDAIMNRQIVLDSGELVGGLVNPMDRSLGTRAIMAQRA